ncbi:diguanylate cyclase VdcA [Thalassotalea insulae]|uniref:diguanylate cyclase n=1 Tax=Thalassotalea insulae TaxID=2056778 RepID=A0ABQ6GSQ0_9GAMM|nr:GGDEF domain-containing protein [Thalassotalea insulae]GLX78412.1 diguanylate cyclase VdcA [Thalassotalea insulae]
MKYHDSMEQADNKLALAIKQLQLWHLPASPINYAVSYEYVSGKNTALIAQIKQHFSLGKKLDNFFIEELYQLYILGQGKFRDEIITEIDDLISGVQQNSESSVNFTSNLIKRIDDNITGLKSQNAQQIAYAIQQIEKASLSFKQKQQQLAQQLKISKQQSQSLKKELAEVKKEIYLDPLTGLYNRKALNKHLESWSKENPNKQVAAIVISVDQMQQITQKYGALISDVLLAKVANKVSSYVGDSGLPVRAGHDEFLILLPEIERSTAGEIAEKIRQGVEKLRFVSSKSGMHLPQMTISTGVNDFKLSQNVQTILNYTRTLVMDLQRGGHNRLTVAN